MSSTNENGRAGDSGFELDGRFYTWSITDIGKDLMLIDRFAGLPIQEFHELASDPTQAARTPILLTMIATSIRAGNPDWTVERIARTVLDLNLSELVWIDADEEETTGPPAPGPDQTGAKSASASKPTSSAAAPAISATSKKTPG